MSPKGGSLPPEFYIFGAGQGSLKIPENLVVNKEVAIENQFNPLAQAACIKD